LILYAGWQAEEEEALFGGAENGSFAKRRKNATQEKSFNPFSK
jgi:hypothetical protein